MAKRTPTRRLKNPKGGLTAAGRAHFKKTEGAHLKPGVTGKADTPEKMRRKGSFLTRFYGRSKLPPVSGDDGKPTRFALAAHAWGEPVPKTAAAARKLAKRGQSLLKRAAVAKKTAAKAKKAAPKGRAKP